MMLSYLLFVYELSPYAVPLAVTALLIVILGLVVVWRENASLIGRAFLWMTLAVALWLAAYSAMYSTDEIAVAHSWAKLALCGVAFIPATLYHFSARVLRQYEQRRRIVQIVWAVTLFFSVLALASNYLVPGVHLYWWGYYPAYDAHSFPFLLFFFLVLVLNLVEYGIAYYKTPPGPHRQRIQALMLAFLVGYLAAIDFLAAYGVPLYPGGYIAILCFLVLAARAIRRYRLVDYTPSFAAEHVLATMADPLLVCDEEQHIRLVNQACCDTLGYTTDELIGKPLADLLAQVEEQPTAKERLSALLKQEVLRDEEFLFCSKEGTVLPIALSIATLAQPGQEQIGHVLIARDLRERKQAEAALHNSEQRLHTVIANAPILLFALDRTGIFTLAEGQFLRALGVEASQVVGRSVFDLYGTHVPDLEQQFRTALSGVATDSIIEIQGMVYDCHYAPLRDARGTPVGVIGVANDISERRKAELALRDSEERYALAARGANDGLWDWNLRSGEMYFSPRWQEMLGGEPGGQAEKPEAWFGRLHPDDLEKVQRQLEAHLNGQSPHFESEYRIRHADGSFRWMLSRGLAVRAESGQAVRIVGSQTDISSRKSIEVQLLKGAMYDALTNLPNRVLFMDRLTMALQRYQRHPKQTFAVLFLDFDRFKVINDSLGHRVGDQLLVAIAQRLQDCLESSDSVARLGGDEFAILLQELPKSEVATHVAERIQAAFIEPVILGEHEVVISASIGIVMSQPTYQHPEDMLRDADIAMYRAKAQGRARYQIFDQLMHQGATVRLQRETQLRRAIEQGALELHYQPIVRLDSGEMVGVEALVRWPQPDGKLLPPLDFIPLAEETGLILPLGKWVLREACGQLRAWHDQFALPPSFSVSVNLSGRQLVHPQMDEQIAAILQQSQLPPACLKLEITESTLIDNLESATRLLIQMRRRGVQVQMDDFGTEYSSLNYLHRFPLDVLKIDRSFIQGLQGGTQQQAIVQAIVTLAHTLGLRIVAEGIETETQLGCLQEMRCEYGQGYLFAPPLSAQVTAQRLQARFPTPAAWSTTPILPSPAAKP